MFFSFSLQIHFFKLIFSHIESCLLFWIIFEHWSHSWDSFNFATYIGSMINSPPWWRMISTVVNCIILTIFSLFQLAFSFKVGMVENTFLHIFSWCIPGLEGGMQNRIIWPAHLIIHMVKILCHIFNGFLTPRSIALWNPNQFFVTLFFSSS